MGGETLTLPTGMDAIATPSSAVRPTVRPMRHLTTATTPGDICPWDPSSPFPQGGDLIVMKFLQQQPVLTPPSPYPAQSGRLGFAGRFVKGQSRGWAPSCAHLLRVCVGAQVCGVGLLLAPRARGSRARQRAGGASLLSTSQETSQPGSKNTH